MSRYSVFAVAAFFAAVLFADGALAQAGGQGAPGGTVPKAAAPGADAKAKAQAGQAKAPPAKIEANFGQWSLVCTEPKTKEEKPTCSLVQALVERDSNQLVFRVTVAYGPQGNLVLRIDGPTGVALQKGLEFSPDEVKTYRMPFRPACPGAAARYWWSPTISSRICRNRRRARSPSMRWAVRRSAPRHSLRASPTGWRRSTSAGPSPEQPDGGERWQ